MERVKEMARPLTFPVFKVAKSSLDFIRFEAEVENYGLMDTALAKLDMKTIKLSGFEEQLKVRAAEAKPPFPTRHDWDSYFKDNKNMNEMKAGERPDTIHLQNLPTKWFLNAYDRSGLARDKPNDYVLKKVFQTFGDIREVDIPTLDPYRYQIPQDHQIPNFTVVFIFQVSNEVEHLRDPDFHLWPRLGLRSIHSVQRIHRFCQSHEFTQRHEIALQRSSRRSFLGS